MNIFIDAHIFDKPYGGSRSYIKGLYSAWIKINPSIHFYIAAYDIENLINEFGKSENLTFIKYASKNKLYRLLLDIPILISKHKIDYAHFQYISPFLKFCKEIVTIHDVLFLDFPELFPYLYRIKNNYLFRRSARRADILLTVSDYSKKAIEKHFKVNSNKIYITPNAISSDFTEIFKKNSNLVDIKEKYNLEKYILFVSRIEPRKNHLSLVEAFVELRLAESGYSLVFVGHNDFPSVEYLDYLKLLPISLRQKIIHLDSIPDIDLISIYINCSLFVYPSLAEGFGIPPLEAAISKVPCICSNATAMEDYVFFDKNLYDPYNKEELKQLIISNLLNRQNEAIENIYQFVKSKYNWKTIATDWNMYFLNYIK
jgi:glycosyltransferase involved in cell wall biosynthesis